MAHSLLGLIVFIMWLILLVCGTMGSYAYDAEYSYDDYYETQSSV
jgi:hypothetical protein